MNNRDCLDTLGLSVALATLLCATATAQGACQLQKVLADDGMTGSEFGEACDVSGNSAILASWKHARLGNDAGAAYVFEYLGASWIETALLVASDGSPGDLFGTSVKIDGATAISASVFDDDNGADSGSAYIFEKQSGAWTQTAKLLASDGAPGDQFGFFTALSGNTAVVTANLDDDLGANSGSAYVFEKQGGWWLQTAKLLASDGAPGDQFGYSSSMSGTTVVISSVFDDDRGQDSGSAYVFDKQGSSWVQTAKLRANDGAAFDAFGISVSIDSTRIIAGAMLDDDLGANSGSAYAFEKQGSSWLQTAKLRANDGAARDKFGIGVSISGTTAVIGANHDDDKGTDSGSAYVFRDTGPSWTQTAKLLARDGAAFDDFGFQVAIGGDTALVGARLDDDLGDASGGAYFYSVTASNCPTLTENTITLPISSGGTQNLTFEGGTALGGQLYMLLGSFTGTFPGVTFNGLYFPLNVDSYFVDTATNPAHPLLVNPRGALTSGGVALAGCQLPAGLPPALAGLELHHALLVIDASLNLLHVSNPVAMRLVSMEPMAPPAKRIRKWA